MCVGYQVDWLHCCGDTGKLQNRWKIAYSLPILYSGSSKLVVVKDYYPIWWENLESKAEGEIKGRKRVGWGRNYWVALSIGVLVEAVVIGNLSEILHRLCHGDLSMY